jgi:hypothetical protein|tara:strand:+ start:280 stop:708 length:429 start_codon:yes stop_codon:yes gene_type:complete
MIDFIQSETKKIMYNCIKKYAENEKKDISDVQLVLGLDENGNTYTLCEQYQPKIELDILGVLGVRIDFLGYSRLAPPFILKSLVRFSEGYNYPLENSKVMCIPTTNEKGKPDVLLFVYNNNAFVDTITFADLFREEDFEIQT